MKRIAFSILLATISFSVNCQSFYYVFFTDKKPFEFNPYEYFDQKTIQRRILYGISLFDSSDFPVNQSYINQIADLSEEYVGESRWFNMAMISATDENRIIIQHLPFVKNMVRISDDIPMKLAEYQEFDIENFLTSDSTTHRLSNQLLSLQGDYFAKNNINGKGVRIAVFDGGFPRVNTHIAFEHLRKNGQIIKTWNFPNKKEDVYGWNSHGTMVLSCIAGIKMNGSATVASYIADAYNLNQMLGLATGAEFLLARTEVNTEPKKEEFWWLLAVEWADKNGADVINSSLGYGIDRYNYADMDGKTSLVSRAANMAAAKGILVCNSAGNEGNDKQWLKIITPADADSILTVGGIEPDLIDFKRINFSSYGPTADGRMKPNVVAFGEAQVAKPTKSADGYATVSGTSFSSPLIAGFAACAWQTNRNRTAMELKSEIEKSASLYPYFDYAYGYGIPQASYFTENQNVEVEPTFEITSNETSIYIKPFVKELDFLAKKQYLYYNIQNQDGTLDYYAQIDLYDYFAKKNTPTTLKYTASDSTYFIFITKDSSLNNKTLNVFFNGYFESYKMEETQSYSQGYKPMIRYYTVDVKNQKPSKWGYKATHSITVYMAYSMFVTNSFHIYNYAKSHAFEIGIRYKYNVCKWYAVGGNFEYGIKKMHYKINNNTFYQVFSGYTYTLKYNKVVDNLFRLEFFQRFRLASTSLGDVYFDLGGYGGICVSSRQETLWKHGDTKNIYNWKESNFPNYGIKVRFGYGILAIFTQCELSGGYKYKPNLWWRDRFSLGIELRIPHK